MFETRCYTPEEWAIKHKVCVKTVYRQIRCGAIKAERFGRQWRIYTRVVISPDPAPRSDGSAFRG